MVDGCVTTALLAVALYPSSQAALYLDKIGSVVVAAYLVWCGVRTIREVNLNKQKQHRTNGSDAVFACENPNFVLCSFLQIGRFRIIIFS